VTAKNVPIARTPVRPIDVYLALRDAWAAELGGPEPDRKSLLVLLAQWHLETDGGARCMNFNLGGIKHEDGDGHDWAEYLTVEVFGGVPRKLMQKFRAYSSLDDAAADYLTLIRKRFAMAWPAVIMGQPMDFAHLLKMGGYYTAPEQQYAAGLEARYTLLEGMIPPDTVSELPPDRTGELNEIAEEVGDEPPDAPEAA
jgi:hypothetical protein